MINLSLPSPTISTLSSSPSHMTSKSPPSPSQSVFRPATPPQNICPRFLRRRARSSLVDAFRVYILHELNQRIPQGGYYVWILHSLLKAARERRDAFLAKEREFERERERERERRRIMGPPPPYQPPTSPSPSLASSLSSSSIGSGSVLMFGRRWPSPRHTRGPSIESEAFSATTSTEPPTSDDEDEVETTHGYDRSGSDDTDGDTQTIETDTDGSSIHTPTSSHFALALPSNLSSAPASQDLPSLLTSPVSHFHHQLQSYPSAPPTNHTDLQIQNLTHLILLHTSHSARTAHDESTRLDALEVRGRRRAWLNRALCPSGLKLTAPPGGRISTNIQRMEIGMGAGHGGLGFAVPIRRSGLGMWVINAEDIEREMEEERADLEADPGQVDAIMLEDDDVQLVGGERFNGYDERNGIEPKRLKVPVPSKRTQLFPVNEVEEEEIEMRRPPPGMLSRSPDSADHSDGEDIASIKFDNINLNQYDDLRELQMDLDIVTGVGFDMMDSSDEEDDPGSGFNVNAPSNASPTSPDSEVAEGGISEGGICVALDIPKPKAFHARSPHLLSGREHRQRQRQHQRANGISLNQGHPVHQYSHPDVVPQNSPPPIPQYPSESANALSSMPPIPGPVVAPISIPQPVYFRAPTPTPPAYTPDMSSSTVSLVTSTSNGSIDPMFRPSSPVTVHDHKSGVCTTVLSTERKHLLPQDVHVNEMGELVSGMDMMGIAEDEGEEFTLAMDLPSKSLKSRFNGVSFTAMGRTSSFRGRVRGASRMDLAPHGGGAEDGVALAVEDTKNGPAWV